MSLGEIQETYQTIQAIDALLTSIENKTERLRSELGTQRGYLREMEYIFFRVSSLMHRLGLPEDIDKAVGTVQRLILMVRILHSALIYLQASTPYGWAMALTAIGGLSLTAAETTNQYVGEIFGH